MAVVELTIRCAMQSFTDRTISCPSNWTVLQLKQHLHEVCESKPEIARQRLIYAGHCLENGEQLEVVLRGRSASNAAAAEDASAPATPQVIHLVCASKELLSNTNGGVRFRKAATTQRSTPPATATSPPTQPTPAPAPAPTDNFNMQYGNAFYGYQPLPQQQQQQPNAYEAYAASYQNYINQMLYYQQQQQFHQMMLQYPHAQHPHHPQQQQQMLFHPMAAFGAGAAAAFGTLQLPPAQYQQQQQYLQQPNHHPLVPVAAGAAPEVVVGGGAAMEEPGQNRQQPDLLDLIYKLVRFSLLAMVLYLYSSWERFFFVLAIVVVIWGVHRRRERDNRQELQQREARRLQQPQVAAVEGAEGEGEGGGEREGEGQANATDTTTPEQQPQQSAWGVFFSTVLSFFTSLIPENPGPLNVN